MTVTTPAAAEGAGEQVIDQLRGQWEAERSQLAKAKEEALAQAEVCDIYIFLLSNFVDSLNRNRPQTLNGRKLWRN